MPRRRAERQRTATIAERRGSDPGRICPPAAPADCAGPEHPAQSVTEAARAERKRVPHAQNQPATGSAGTRLLLRPSNEAVRLRGAISESHRFDFFSGRDSLLHLEPIQKECSTGAGTMTSYVRCPACPGRGSRQPGPIRPRYFRSAVRRRPPAREQERHDRRPHRDGH